MIKPHSPATAIVLTAARALGYVDYDVTRGSATTKKLIRLRAPNGTPVVVQTNNITPRLWLLPEHEAGKLSHIGTQVLKKDDHRHSNLQQVREFSGRPLVKVIVEAADDAVIRSALEAVGARWATAYSAKSALISARRA